MSDLDVKKAVALAKDYVASLFGGEGLTNLGLEEVEYDDTQEQWHITLGFSRSWDNDPNVLGLAPPHRTYKIVVIDKEGRALSVKNRATADAG